jgi:hypothetical protein
MEHSVEIGQRSPTYLHAIRSYTREGGPFDFWKEKLLLEVDFAGLEDWSLWLSGRELSSKSVRNILGAFRSFLRWCGRRGLLETVPEASSRQCRTSHGSRLTSTPHP